MSERVNPDRLHTLGLPLSNGEKPDDDYFGHEPVDNQGKTEHERWLESDPNYRKQDNQ